MAIFAIIFQQPNEALTKRIPVEFPDNYFRLGDLSWFVSGSGSAQTISDKLEITSGKIGATAVVVQVNSYFGFANMNLWAWLKTKWEAS